MLHTHVRPSRDLRNHYAEIVQLLKDHDQVVITNNGRGEAVLISIDDYAMYEDFLHERYIAQELNKSIAEANDPDTTLLSHEDVWKNIKEKYDF